MSSLSQIDNASWAAELAVKNAAALEAGKVDLVTGRKPSLRARVQLREAGAIADFARVNIWFHPFNGGTPVREA